MPHVLRQPADVAAARQSGNKRSPKPASLRWLPPKSPSASLRACISRLPCFMSVPLSPRPARLFASRHARTAAAPRSHHASAGAIFNDLLEFLSAERLLGPRPLPVRVEQTDDAGNGLFVADVQDIEPGELLLSLPLAEAVVVPEPALSRAHYAVRVGNAILRALADDASLRRTWMPALPPLTFRVPLATPDLDAALSRVPGVAAYDLVTCSVAVDLRQEHAALQQAMAAWVADPSARERAHDWNARLKSSAGDAPGPAGWIAWAVSLALSRSFYHAPADGDGLGSHIVAPGIDMANHAPWAEVNAEVRVRHGADSCQGVQAVDEVCDGAHTLLRQDPSGGAVLELVAGNEGLRSGDEVRFCYRRAAHPLVFAAHYGFVPRETLAM